MLVIRLQRTGRKGHAMFRIVVQDSRRTPSSGKVVARLGSYDPHAKSLTLDKEKASFYLEHGAQPSERVISLLKSEGVKLPDWVQPATKKRGDIKNPDKRRSTRPPEPVKEEAPAEASEPDPAAEESTTPADETEDVKDEASIDKAEPAQEESAEASEEVTPDKSEAEATNDDAPAVDEPAANSESEEVAATETDKTETEAPAESAEPTPEAEAAPSEDKEDK